MDVTYKNRDVNWMSTVQGKSREQDNSMTEQFPYFRPEGIFFTHWYLLAYTLAVFGGARLLTQYSCGETFGPIHIGLKL